LLVVTCPCALGMATPLSVSSALRRAAELGILFKGGEFIEELAKPGLIVFDKTGTLTEGRLELVHFQGSDETKALLRAAEARSGHPIARAVQRSIPENRLVCTEVRELDAGLLARVGEQDVLVGALSRLEQTLGNAPERIRRDVAAQAALGRTPIVVAVDGEFSAVAALSDRLREDARSGLQRLQALGFRFQILSGDHQRAVDALEKQLQVPFLRAKGHATPEDKLATVKALRVAGERVLMVGDGVNDAAAMAAANVGIAVHGGAEACLATADVFMTRAGLEPVALAAEGARRTLRTIRRGIVLSLAYNAVGIALAASGVLSPLFAAVLMPLSSVTVVSVALRSRTFRKEVGS
ncbi:MAG TPA: HAD-IC family P-type ATPase, partial [Polyangiales bacterium]|nr:HAD-IC family P-type ATPase [Polyangiales bacterium]